MIYGHNLVSVKIPTTFSVEMEESTFRFMWNHKECHITKIILRKMKLKDSHLYFKAYRWHKRRLTDQQNGESRNKRLYVRSNTFWNECQIHPIWKTGLFISSVDGAGCPRAKKKKKKKLDPLHHTTYKN